MPTRSKSEQGASAITVAISMLVLLGMAAIALDLSAGWNERRQDQTASDISAVAGALSFGDNDAIADEVMAVASLNLGSPISVADWIGCSDPDRPLGFTPINHSTHGTLDCISLNPSYVRVRLPDQAVETTFGRILGIDSITTSADTIVTLIVPGETGSLPFAVRGNSGSGEICLDTGTGQIEPPCTGNESGSFGNIAPPLFGRSDIGMSPECAHQTSANNYVPQSIAMGIDHFIYEFTQSQWSATGWDPGDNTNNNSVDAVTNMDECNDTGGEVAEAADGIPINGVYVDTGNNVKADVTEGLMTGTSFPDGLDARLTRTDSPRSVDGYALDNTPLWDHLNIYSGGDPLNDGECDGDTYGSLSIDDKNIRMRDCLEGWASSDGIIFSDSILDSPARLGIAPRVWHNNLGSGLSYRPVKDFEIVYIHGLWFDDKDKTVFYPGEGTAPISMNNMKDIEQVTAYLLDEGMVSTKVEDALGGLTNDNWQPEIYR